MLGLCPEIVLERRVCVGAEVGNVMQRGGSRMRDAAAVHHIGLEAVGLRLVIQHRTVRVHHPIDVLVHDSEDHDPRPGVAIDLRLEIEEALDRAVAADSLVGDLQIEQAGQLRGISIRVVDLGAGGVGVAHRDDVDPLSVVAGIDPGPVGIVGVGDGPADAVLARDAPSPLPRPAEHRVAVAVPERGEPLLIDPREHQLSMIVEVVEQPAADETERLEKGERGQQQDEVGEEPSQHSEIAPGDRALGAVVGRTRPCLRVKTSVREASSRHLLCFRLTQLDDERILAHAAAGHVRAITTC